MAMLNNQMVNNDGDIPRKRFNHQVRNMGKQKKVRFQFSLINRILMVPFTIGMIINRTMVVNHQQTWLAAPAVGGKPCPKAAGKASGS